MKLTFSSKTFGALFLIALAATGSVGLHKPANAQLQTQACLIASEGVPNGIFDGVNLSAEEFAAYDAITNRYDKEVTPRLDAKAKKVIKPDARIGFFQKQGVEIPPQLQETISIETGDSTAAQIDSLTAKYGQYGRFVPETTLVYNQELYEEFKKEQQVKDNQILAVMNPEQRQKYQQNTEAIQRREEACYSPYSPFIKVGDSYEIGGLYL